MQASCFLEIKTLLPIAFVGRGLCETLSDLTVCTFVCAPCTCLVFTEAREGFRSPGPESLTVVSHPCGWWESYLDPLQGQPVLLTNEPSFQPQLFSF